MGQRFGVSISYYGGVSWELAELERELARRNYPILGIRNCPYPEMAKAEQVRRARIEGVETVVFLDSHVSLDVEGVEELVSVAESHGLAVVSEETSPWALEAAAVRREVIEAVVRTEERRYQNSAVDTIWQGTRVASVPVASPWYRNGAPLIPGEYLTDSQAFVHRAKMTGAVVAWHMPDRFVSRRPKMKTRIVNSDAPIGNEPGTRFALCIPSFGSLDYDQLQSVYALEKAGMVSIGLHDCAWIDQARSWLTEQAMERGRGVFFLDHDIIFHPNDVLRLCEQALERNAVVAGPYCMRKSGKNIIGSFDLPPGPIQFFGSGNTFPAFYSGLGFAAVPFDVLDQIELPLLDSKAIAQGVGFGTRIRPWYALDCSTGFYAGEDVSFCNRVHDLTVGVVDPGPGQEAQWGLSHSGRTPRVFLDSRVRIAHRGSYDYQIEDVGIVVPRFRELDAQMFASRQEAKDALISAEKLPVDVRLDSLEFAQP